MEELGKKKPKGPNDEIHIRIKENGTVRITDKDNNDLDPEPEKVQGDWHPGGHSIQIIGRATWITGSPICVWHDSAVY